MTTLFYVNVILLIIPIYCQYEGEKCILHDSQLIGKCVSIQKCPHALHLIKSNGKPQHCGFEGFNPIVCCLVDDIEEKNPVVPSGTKSKQMCEAYYKEETQTFNAVVFGGVKSLAKEFPHMAILGYGKVKGIQWLCGGSLISDEYVLTAAHCMISAQFGPVIRVRLGDLDINNTTDDAKPVDVGISKTFTHPQYKPPSHYNDIALIKLTTKITFGEYIKPACLQTQNNDNEALIATGWGKTDFAGESSSHLLKVDLQLVSYPNCSKSYANVSPKKLSKGIVDEIQLCAGGSEGQDTCPGDSGGPIQTTEFEPIKHHTIVGVTSFGKACGVGNSAGVYVRVTAYLKWLEPIVWPND